MSRGRLSRLMLTLAALVTMGAGLLACATPEPEPDDPTWSASQAHSELRRLDDAIRSALRGLPDSYGPDPAGELRQIRGVETEAKKLATAVADPRLVPAGDERARVRRNLEVLRHEVSLAHAQQQCSAARHTVLAMNERGDVAGEAELGAFKARIAALATALDGKAAKVLQWWRDELSRLRREQPEVAERSEELRKKAEWQERKQAVRQQQEAARAAADSLLRQMARGEDPIGADDLATFRTAVDELEAIFKPAAAYYRTKQLWFDVHNALFRDDAPKAVAERLGGKLIAGGMSSGKELKVSFFSQAGWCYTLVAHWKRFTGTEKAQPFRWSAKGGEARLQRYRLWVDGAPWPPLQGACTVRGVPVKVTAGLTFAGTKNGLRYAVVGWPRAEFPLHQAVYLRLIPGDLCDTEAWAELWTHPVPGTIVYRDREPLLVLDAGKPGDPALTAASITGHLGERLQKRDATSVPPRTRAFTTRLRPPECPTGALATHQSSRKLDQCETKLEAKYDKLLAEAEKKRDKARDIPAYRAADKRMQELEAKAVQQLTKKCGPLRAEIVKRWEQTFNALVDHFVDTPYRDRFDRPSRLRDEFEGR